MLPEINRNVCYETKLIYGRFFFECRYPFFDSVRQQGMTVPARGSASDLLAQTLILAKQPNNIPFQTIKAEVYEGIPKTLLEFVLPQNTNNPNGNGSRRTSKVKWDHGDFLPDKVDR